jgi:DNA polymerase III sliding clamp (beta) subunit (PCNA family)
MQTETSLTLDQVNGLFSSLAKPATKVTVDVKSLLSCMENVTSIHDSKGSFDIVVKGGKLRLRNSSNYGKVEDVIKASVEGKDGEYSVNPNLFGDLLKCVAPKEIEFNIVPNKYIYFSQKLKLGRGTYVCNLA